jgi:hypothetical protein
MAVLAGISGIELTISLEENGDGLFSSFEPLKIYPQMFILNTFYVSVSL